MPHIVLLGDSIFDNRAYVRPGEPDVVRQLRAALPHGWRATLAAVDGATIADVPRQMTALPPDASHLVLSAGGNDALAHLDILEQPVRSVGEALEQFAAVADRFASMYAALLRELSDAALPLTVCTIYNGAFPDAALQRRARMGLDHFNTVILRAAFARRMRVVELRSVCTEAADYANPIEPSARGGEKIARTIARAIVGPHVGEGASEVYV